LISAIYRKRLTVIGHFILGGAIAGTITSIIFLQIDKDQSLFIMLRGGLVGILIGVILGFGEEFMLPYFGRRLGFFFLNFIRVLLYTMGMVFVLVLVNAFDISFTPDTGLLEGAKIYINYGSSIRDLIFTLGVSIMLSAIFQIRSLHNPGDIWRFLIGKYHYPEVENRIFLFADLANSTTIAENLGPLSYSSLLRDIFFDISEAILAWKGQVYQYVGDGVIVTWPHTKGTQNAACIQCFFEMTKLLEKKSDLYQQRYGYIPSLRSGINSGEVVTTWVGEAKKELAFHGDTVNTTARIQSVCKQFESRCLLPKVLCECIKLPKGFVADSKGEVELRGKQELINLFSIEML
jgi:adenylate cyclase